MSSLPKHGESRQPFIQVLEQGIDGQESRLTKLLEETPGAHAELVRLLTHLDFSEDDAKRHWKAIVRHRTAMIDKLGRATSLQVAAIDYFQMLEGKLVSPKVLEMSRYLATEKRAITDGLTGLYNRVFFDASLRRELKRSRRYGLAFSLVMIDIDDFKAVNDVHGHIAGDEALLLTSNVVRANTREIDVACRYGGEEFALILPETSRTGAFIVAERIRLDVKDTFARHQIGNTHVNVSISGGIALYPHDANSAEGLVRMADRALYRAKHEGKDQITLHADEKRRSPRLQSKKLLIFREPKKGRPELQSETMNLSRNGALVESRIPLNIGTELEIEIHLPTTEQTYLVRGRVVRLEEISDETGDKARYQLGVAFLADTDQDTKNLEGLAAELYRPHELELGENAANAANDVDQTG